MNVRKCTGDIVPFAEPKLRNSLRIIGATESQISSIVDDISVKLKEEISTAEIYRLIVSALRERSDALAVRYRLKHALREHSVLGSLFQTYVAELLKSIGYTIKQPIFLPGVCTEHHTELIASKENIDYLVSCVEVQRGEWCGEKTAISLYQKVCDINSAATEHFEAVYNPYKCFLITNGWFSVDTIRYSKNKNILLLGWNFPADGSLNKQIDHLSLYPITCLSSLSLYQKKQLFEKNIITCRQLACQSELLIECGLKPRKIEAVMRECLQVCGC